MTTLLFFLIGAVTCIYGASILVFPAAWLRKLLEWIPISDKFFKFSFLTKRVNLTLEQLTKLRGLLFVILGLLFIGVGLQGNSNVQLLTNRKIYSRWVTDLGVSPEKYKDQALKYRQQDTYGPKTTQVFVFFYGKLSEPSSLQYRWLHDGNLLKTVDVQYRNGYNDVRLDLEGRYLPLGQHTVEIMGTNQELLAQVKFSVSNDVVSPSP